MKFANILAGILAVMPCGALAQDAENVMLSTPYKIPKEVITRSITLEELGFGTGLTFRQLSGQSTVFIPISDTAPLLGGTITLEITHGASVPVDRYLQVSVGGRPTLTRALGNRQETISLQVPFDASAVSSGFLALGLTYSGAFSDQVCIDERASGDFVEIAPHSEVALTLATASIDTPAMFAGFRPRGLRVALPDQPSLGSLAAATRAAALFGAETGNLRFGVAQTNESRDWTEAEVQIQVATSGVQSEMRVSTDADFPRLQLRGTDPQLGLWQLASDWSGMAGTESAITTAISDQGPDASFLPFTELAADLTPQSVVSTSDVLVPFQSSDIPPGKTVGAISLIMAAALDAEGRGATASVFLNETLLGNRPMPNGTPERLSFDVPKGLIGRDNQLRVTIQRQPAGGECRFKPQGYPAQILPGSALQLIASDPQDIHFFTLRRDFGDGVQIVLDPALDLDETLPWIAAVAGSMIPGRATIVPRANVGAIEPGLPFFVISDNSPSDEQPSITFDAGRVEILDNDGETMFAGDELDRLGVAQVVNRGDQQGLWLRPGRGPAPEPSAQAPLIFNRGDLSLIGQEGVIVSTSTRSTPVLAVSYPDRTSRAQILAKYRPWIVGGIWAVLTLIVLMVFQRIYRHRRNDPAG